ncbi:MAG: hypothetical protein K2Y30_11045 [Flavobacteriaceae bacterium]|nr:hypothetical protein [Flavobacteriaceae bacterium]
MQLTTEQIECINQTLIEKGIKFDDIKLEILDHIASEIESTMNLEQESFEIVFKSVFEKWKSELQISSSYAWLGAFFEAPRFVVDKLVTYSKKQILIVLFLSAVFAASLSILGYCIGIELFSNILRTTLTGLFYVMVGSTIISLFLIWRSSFKTTFGRLFLYRGWVVFVFFFMSSVDNEPLKHFDSNHTFTENFISCLLYGCLFFYSHCQISMALKHFKIFSKFKMV